MGASWKLSGFIAAARFQMGLLSTKPGEVITWDSTMTSPIKLASISLPLNQPGADGVAIRFHCGKCVPKVASHKHNVGGWLWVQFRGDEGYSTKIAKQYQNKVFVHLARKYVRATSGKGTELWKVLSEGESYETPNQYTVHVCSIVGDIATVTMGDSETNAKQSCQGPTTTAPPATPAPTTAPPATPAPTTAPPATPSPPTGGGVSKHLAEIGRKSNAKGGPTSQCLPDTATRYTLDTSKWPRVKDGTSKKVATSCCPADGSGPGKRMVCGGKCCGEKTFEEAAQACKEAGMKLCTAAELDRKTAGKGCSNDFALNWVSDACGAPTPTPAPTP